MAQYSNTVVDLVALMHLAAPQDKWWVHDVVLPAVKGGQTNLFTQEDLGIAQSIWERAVVQVYLNWAL